MKPNVITFLCVVFGANLHIVFRWSMDAMLFTGAVYLLLCWWTATRSKLPPSPPQADERGTEGSQ
jgi:hypothetical protein